MHLKYFALTFLLSQGLFAQDRPEDDLSALKLELEQRKVEFEGLRRENLELYKAYNNDIFRYAPISLYYGKSKLISYVSQKNIIRTDQCVSKSDKLMNKKFSEVQALQQRINQIEGNQEKESNISALIEKLLIQYRQDGEVSHSQEQASLESTEQQD